MTDFSEDEFLKKKTCSFTGHRPERLKFPEGEVIDWLALQIRSAVSCGFTRFINGTQRGVDIWAAEEIIRLKKEGACVKLISAIPFEGVENGKCWDGAWRVRFRRVVNESDEVYVVGDSPGRAAFFARDDWMVDRSSRLIAVYNGGGGGTRHTVKYAEDKGVRVIEFRPAVPAGAVCRGRVKIWLDDNRPAPEGYLHCHSVNEAKAVIRSCERKGIKIDVIDCDHDLGEYAADGGDGIRLIDWLEAGRRFYRVEIHTMNPVGRANMQRIIDRYPEWCLKSL
ncbi:MAG: DUF1273 family protein [Clostridia bacterium]|nr:DUF1273 family protein [Clostridia bacterium]MBR5767256.1 DUF1273 family protein [Clostridia bacterium]